MTEEEKRLEEMRRRRAEQFSVHIADEEAPAPRTRAALNSYSDPEKRTGGAQRRVDAAERKAETAHRRRNREKRLGNRWFFRLVWMTMVVLVAIVLGQYAISGINDMLAVGRMPTSVGTEGATFEVRTDEPIGELAKKLSDNKVINNANFFELYATLTKAVGTFQNGTYQVKSDMDYQALINTFQSNYARVDTVKITFTEGMNVPEIAALMEKNGVCSAAEILKLCSSSTYDTKYDIVKAIPGADKRYYKLEGYLFPDTYEFYMDEDPQSALQKLISNCNKKLNADLRNQAATRGMTLDQVLNLASIVQMEAADTDDMHVISSILQNRLKSGAEREIYTLDCDSTTYYPYRTKVAAAAAMGAEYKSKYDTYTVKGLPAGPICNPGIDAINSVLNPKETSKAYYYFCHDKDKKAYYATTYSQHQKNLVTAGLRE